MGIQHIINGAINLLRGELGSFGDLVFEVHRGSALDYVLGTETASKLDRYGINGKNFGQWIGDTKVLTFDDYERKTRGRYAKHELINQQTILEHLGEDTEKITLEIKLLEALGVDIEVETEKIRGYVKDGHTDFLIIGGRVIGDWQWVITDLTEKLKVVDTFGRVKVSELSLTFESYCQA